MTHGALVGAICAILPRWMGQWGEFSTGSGYFISIFLVVRYTLPPLPLYTIFLEVINIFFTALKWI